MEVRLHSTQGPPRAVITGGAGFIGSTLADALVERGHEVTVLDDLSTGSVANLHQAMAGGATLRELDVRDPDAVRAALMAARPQVVYHLAAQIDVRSSVADPLGDLQSNVAGTVNVLDAARQAGVQRVVFTSSGGAVYGDAETVPTPEGASVQPLSPYGQSKLAGEGYCELFGRLHGLETVSLRFANVYGPRQAAEGEGGVVALFCAAALEGRAPVVFGDGRQTRDFVYVGDVADALAVAGERSAGGPVNVGSGEEISVLGLIDTLRRTDARLADTRFAPPRLGEVRRSCLAIDRAQEQLGWRPTVGLRAGLRRTLAWHAHVTAGVALAG